jgi:exonuclease 3'-5' domain-containing protein 1
MTLAARQRAATVKDTGLQLYAPETGGSYAVFDERPLKTILLEYCVQDMVYMPELWDVYQRRKDGFRKVMVKGASERRGGGGRVRWRATYLKGGIRHCGVGVGLGLR